MSNKFTKNIMQTKLVRYIGKTMPEFEKEILNETILVLIMIHEINLYKIINC